MPVMAEMCCPKPEAVALLSQVVARLHGLDMPVVQFIHVSADRGAASPARDFAEASLERLGRTLLASLHSPHDPGQAAYGSDPTGTAIGRRRTRKPAIDVPEIVPDVGRQGLYHACIGAGSIEAGQVSQVPPAVWLGEARLDFRILVIDCGPLAANPAAVELVSRCHGSILVVTSGTTLLDEIRDAARQVLLAGGTLLGSVLHDASPAPRYSKPPWLQRLARLRRAW